MSSSAWSTPSCTTTPPTRPGGPSPAAAPARVLGDPVVPAPPIGRAVPSPTATAGRLDAEVLWVDRFGNAQLNVTPADTGPGPIRLAGAGAVPGAPLRIV